MLFTRKKKHAPSDSSASDTPFWAGYSEDAVLQSLRSSRGGLPPAEAKKRLKSHGHNMTERRRRFVLLTRVASQLKDPLVAILLFSGILLYSIGHAVDSYLIFAVLGINLIIAVAQEGKVSKAFELLRATDQLYAPVKRGGKETEIPAQDLVPGDIVSFRAGSKVPADIRILSQNGLQANESALTGEWVPVNKNAMTLVNNRPLAEQVNMVWKGTTIVTGSGSGVVVATGRNTVVGAIAEDLYSADSKTPLQRQVRQLAMWIMALILFSVLCIVIITLLQGASAADAILTAIALSVAAIPSGLPAAITVVLVFGMRSVLRNNGLVRNMLAAETLGSATWILTDKTGTLTTGMMTLSEIVLADSREQVPGPGLTPLGRSFAMNAYLGTNGSRSYRSDQGSDSDGERVLTGSAIDQAFVRAREETDSSSPNRDRRVAYIPFTSARRYSAALLSEPSGDRTYCVVGAPELIIDRADSFHAAGKISPLTDKKRRHLRALLDGETENGRRVVGIGTRRVSASDPSAPEDESADAMLARLDQSGEFAFGALLVLEDAVRADAPEAIASIRKSHIATTMVTGDNPGTALFVARKSGIITEGDSDGVLLGDSLHDLTDEELFAKAGHVRVFARMLPDHKSRLLSVLLERGETVAMTGDGINDAPALHRASIGIAVASGTDVAKEASDLVLLKNSFSTIVSSIMEGRRILRNLKKILIYLLSTSFSETVLVAGGLLATAALPITPAQILWANVIEEAFIAFAFAFEKEGSDIARLDPRNKQTASIISGNVRKAVVILASSVGLFLLASYYFLSFHTDLSQEQIQTVMFIAVSVDSIFLALSLKRLNKSIFLTNPFSNPWLVGAIGISVGVLLIAFTVPALASILSLTAIPGTAFLIIPLSALFHVTVIESIKYFLFRGEMASR